MPKVGVQTAIGVAIAVLIALGIGLGVTYLPNGATSSTSHYGTTSTLTTTNNSSLSSIIIQSSSVPCSTPIPSNMTIYAIKNINLTLCVRFFYYSSGAPLNFTSTSQLSIGAVSNGSGILTYPPSNALSNFTVTAQPSNFSIGGQSNENEGILVEYTIHPLANGSYILNLGWLAPQIQKCWAEFDLVVGNGLPNYFPVGTTCQTIGETGTGTFSPYPSGFLFAEVVGYYVALRA